MERLKKLLALFSGVVTAYFGWVGWLLLLYAAAMTVDFITGSVAALKAGQWSSTTARKKLWKKCGSFFALGAAGLVDLLVGLLTKNLPGAQALFVCPALFLPMAAVWYILTEIGSVAENAAALGAPVPAWLKKGVELMKETAQPQQMENHKKKQ